MWWEGVKVYSASISGRNPIGYVGSKPRYFGVSGRRDPVGILDQYIFRSDVVTECYNSQIEKLAVVSKLNTALCDWTTTGDRRLFS